MTTPEVGEERRQENIDGMQLWYTPSHDPTGELEEQDYYDALLRHLDNSGQHHLAHALRFGHPEDVR